MAPKDVYQDDSTLSTFLDALIDPSNQENDPARVRSAECPPVSGKISVSKRHLREGISTANELLRESGQCNPLPILSDDGENVADVLSAALASILRLSRCCKANANLRVEAERATQASHDQIDQLSRLLRVTKEKLEKKESSLTAMRNTLADAEAKHRSRIRQLTTERSSLKSSLTSAAHRENQLSMEATQRERQFSMLQKRVHTLMASSKKLSIEPVVTSSMSKGQLSRGRYAAFADGASASGGSDCGDGDDEENGPLALALEENYLMRGAVRAVHAELDDFFAQYPEAFPTLHQEEKEEDQTQYSRDCPIEEGTISEGESRRSEGDTEVEREAKLSTMPENTFNGNILPPGPTEERMRLPFDMIREEFEENLERKLNAVRKALASIK